jgi:hypothetical protein
MESSQQQQGSLGAAFDPRQRIYRDPFNELVVFVVSAASAMVVVPVILLIVGVFVHIDLIPFIAASVVLELILIFGLARPQMKPVERVQWSLLWGFSAAVMAFLFWELVYSSVL